MIDRARVRLRLGQEAAALARAGGNDACALRGGAPTGARDHVRLAIRLGGRGRVARAVESPEIVDDVAVDDDDRGVGILLARAAGRAGRPGRNMDADGPAGP